MRTLSALAIVACALVVAALMRIDADSTVGLAMVAWLLGLAIFRPRWLRLKGAVSDEESSRAGAAITAAIAAFVIGILLGWRLTAIYRAREACVTTSASVAPGHARARVLERRTSIPLGPAMSCGELLEIGRAA
jgi:hypothetical protein